MSQATSFFLPVPGEEIAAWCAESLGSEPAQTLFLTVRLSTVLGLELADGRRVVLKARTPSPRIAACHRIQEHLWHQGFRCPQPLAGPSAVRSLTLTAEELVAGGEQLAPGPDSPEKFARALAEVVRRAAGSGVGPELAPAPPWAAWDHEEPGLWPRPARRTENLNEVHGPEWLDRAGRRIRQRLARFSAPSVVGHGDWESQNIRWKDRELWVVHDWDSLVWRPEATVAGLASAVFPATGGPETATVDESEAFLAAYETARARVWGPEEREAAWAASAWVLAFNAKVEQVDLPEHPVWPRLEGDLAERLRRAAA